MENTIPAILLNDKRVINGWAFFDWANSAFALSITAAIFPSYFTAVVDDNINIGSFTITDSSLYSFAIAFSYLIIALVSPALSGIADYSGKKKFFLRFFTILGSLSSIVLFFFQGMGQLWLGTFAFIFAMVGFAGGLVFYNSYLPLIATEDQYDKVSAKGFAYGYLGSVILLIINLVVILKPTLFGIANDDHTGLAARIAFLTVGFWWFGFAQIPFKRLPKDSQGSIRRQDIHKGFDELKKVWLIIKKEVQIKTFLTGFFFYNAGVQSIIFLAGIFAAKELHFESSELIQLILLLQIVGIGGAYFFAFVSKIKGNKFSIVVMLIIWILICFAAFSLTEKLDFYILGGFVGMVMGGIQSMSRSTYSKLIPEGTKDTATYFSFMDVLDKISIILGTFSFGIAEYLTGNIRYSLLVLALFFVIGLYFILRLNFVFYSKKMS